MVILLQSNDSIDLIMKKVIVCKRLNHFYNKSTCSEGESILYHSQLCFIIKTNNVLINIVAFREGTQKLKRLFLFCKYYRQMNKHSYYCVNNLYDGHK